MIAKNVGELVAALKKMDQAARVFTIEPPFDGVKLVDQSDGSILICRPRGPESKNFDRMEQQARLR